MFTLRLHGGPRLRRYSHFSEAVEAIRQLAPTYKGRILVAYGPDNKPWAAGLRRRKYSMVRFADRDKLRYLSAQAVHEYDEIGT